MTNKYSKLFYRSIARIRAIGSNPGIVTTDMMRTVFHIGWLRASKLREELTVAGVLRKWVDSDLKDRPKDVKPRGNILWENMSKFRVPAEITKKENVRVKDKKRKRIPLKRLG